MKDYRYFEKLARTENKNRKQRLEIRYYCSSFIGKTIIRKLKKAAHWLDLRWGTHARNKMIKGIKVEKNKIFIMTFQGKLVCNPRYIAEELLSRNIPLEIVVCGNGVLPPSLEGRENVRAVKRDSLMHFVEQASSAVWIDNAINCEWFPMKKKEGQLYLQTWHGSLGLKRIDPETQTKRWLYSAKHSVAATDYLFSNSDFETDVFRETYWPSSRVLLMGHARNDIFFDEAKMDATKNRVLSALNLPQQVRVALYAPTFRDAKTDEFDVGSLPFEMLYDAIKKRFGGEWVIGLRLHPRDKTNVAALLKEFPFLFDASCCEDMQELLCACDMGITDYSSWICDYVFTRRPAFVFAPDLAHYMEKDRGFYYPLNTAPFPLAESFSELLRKISEFDEKIYRERVEDFLHDKGCVDDGSASKRICDFIEAYLNGEDLTGFERQYLTLRGL